MLTSSKKIWPWGIRVYSYFRKKVYVQALYAVFIAIGPLLLGYAKFGVVKVDPPEAIEATVSSDNSTDNSFESKFWYAKELANWFSKHDHIAFFCYFIPLVGILSKTLTPRLDRKARIFESLNEDGLIAQLNVFDEVVGQKLEVLGTQVNSSKNLIPNGGVATISNHSSQQRVQMRALVEGVYKIFEFMIDDKKININVVLFEMAGIYPVEFVCFAPIDEGPTVQIEDFKDKKLAVCRCAKDNKIIIIENLKTETAKRKASQFFCSEPRDGSLICFPCYHRHIGNTKFVLTILASKNHTFSLAESIKYEKILNSFAKRVLVEFNLLVLQNSSAGTTNATTITSSRENS